MATVKLPIHVHNGSLHWDDHVIMLGESLLKRWKIPANQPITLQFGSLRFEVKVVPVANLNALRLQQSMAERLGIHHGITLAAVYRPSSRLLRLGPVISVLVSRIHAASDRPFGNTTPFCRELTDACSKLGAFVYFFSPAEMASPAQSVDGWCYAGRWVKRSMPVGDVIYNRLTTRRLENKTGVQRFFQEAKSRYGAAVFNEKYLNKTEVFAALGQDAALRGYLPESHLFQNYAMLKSMCARHSIVFLKPITGSLGKGIIRISRQSGSSYVCHATHLNGVRRSSFGSLAALFASISGKMRSARYQIQQGLRLIEVNGRPVDFRALVQKSDKGEWMITSIMARIAGNNTFVSNLARGGTISMAAEGVARSNVSPQQRASVVPRLRKAALNIAAGVEAQIEGHFAELGIDLAVDASGKVWLLEVNSKPSKDHNTPTENNKIRPSVRMIVKYAQYLAKF